MLGQSNVSSAGALLLLAAAIAFVPSKVSKKRRVIIGILHVSAHLSAALILMMLLEVGVETCIRHKLLATSGKVYFHIVLDQSDVQFSCIMYLLLPFCIS